MIRSLPTRLAELDGLRAVAVVAVLLVHGFGATFPGGFLGVDLFFAISGFIITRLLLEERARTGRIALGRFYARRARRIGPALGVLLAGFALYVALSRLATGTVTGHGYGEVAVSALSLMNWARAFEWMSGGALGHLWSLGVEAQFYLVWPPVLLALCRLPPGGRLPAVLALALAVLLWRWHLAAGDAAPERTYNGTDTRADALLAGAALAFLPPGTALARRAAAAWALPALALGAGILTLQWQGAALNRWGLTALALASAWAVLAAVEARAGGPVSRALGAALAQWLGRRSYSLYLWHYPLIELAAFHGQSGPLARLAAIALALGAADASYRFVERPFLAGRPRASAMPAL